MRFIVRGVVRLTSETRAESSESERRPLQGSVDEIRSDLDLLAAQGVTEVFLDLNWDPKTVSDDVSSEAAMENAERVLVALAPPTT